MRDIVSAVIIGACLFICTKMVTRTLRDIAHIKQPCVQAQTAKQGCAARQQKLLDPRLEPKPKGND